MYVWKVCLKSQKWFNDQHYTFFGIASSAKVAANQTLRLAKKMDCGTDRRIVSVECLGELDFSTK